MSRALILGAGGQDGAFLSRFLLEKGYEVLGASRDADRSSFENLKKLGIEKKVEKISINANEFRTIFSAIKKYQPTEIYNLSGQSSVGLSFEQPIETFESIAVANLNLLEAVRMSNYCPKVYNAGSSECFGNTNTPAVEETIFEPRSPYAIAKATAYWQVKNYRESYGIHASTGILFNHESALRSKRFVTAKIITGAINIMKKRQEKLYLGNLKIKRDWGYAGEYVDAMWRIIQQEKPQDYIVATGQTNSLEDFVKTTFEILNLNWENYVEQKDELRRPSDISISMGNPKKAKKELGWEAKLKMKEVIELTINEYLKDENNVL